MIYFFQPVEMPPLKLGFFYLQVIKNFLLLINIFQMKYLQNDLITPLERLAESDVLYVKVHSTKKCMFVKCERLHYFKIMATKLCVLWGNKKST